MGILKAGARGMPRAPFLLSLAVPDGVGSGEARSHPGVDSSVMPFMFFVIILVL